MPLSVSHVSLRLVGREELATFELTKSPLDLLGDFVLPLMEPFIFAAQHFERSPDDFIRILIGAGLNRLRDRLFVFRTQGNGHTRLSVAICPPIFSGLHMFLMGMVWNSVHGA